MLKLERTFDTRIQSLMRHRGCPIHDVVGVKNMFDIEASLERIQPTELYYDVKFKSIGTKKQLSAINKLLVNPFKLAPVVCISSMPTDHKAKVLAANIMYNAVQLHPEQRKFRALELPVWHRVYGTFSDSYRDRTTSKPSMMIITNVNSDSTQVKIEKVRDLLEMYDDIPRIVVTTGEDPITFFANRLKYPLKIGVLLGQTTVSSASLLDL